MLKVGAPISVCDLIFLGYYAHIAYIPWFSNELKIKWWNNMTYVYMQLLQSMFPME